MSAEPAPSSRNGELEVALRLSVSGFSLAIEARCAAFPLLVVGPSGSGKTTLLECLAGLREEPEGRVAWGGTTWLDTKRGVRLPPRARRVGFVTQQPSLFPHLTVRENVAYARVHGRQAGSRHEEEEWLAALGVGELSDRRAGLVSGGEAQRVALARALAARPSLLLLDEPFAHLDPPARAASQAVLRDVLERHTVPFVQVGHDRDVRALSPRTIWLLWEGRLAAVGSPDSVVRAASDARQRTFLEGFLAL